MKRNTKAILSTATAVITAITGVWIVSSSLDARSNNRAVQVIIDSIETPPEWTRAGIQFEQDHFGCTGGGNPCGSAIASFDASRVTQKQIAESLNGARIHFDDCSELHDDHITGDVCSASTLIDGYTVRIFVHNEPGEHRTVDYSIRPEF